VITARMCVSIGTMPNRQMKRSLVIWIGMRDLWLKHRCVVVIKKLADDKVGFSMKVNTANIDDDMDDRMPVRRRRKNGLDMDLDLDDDQVVYHF
jgi:hypothetical protein